MPRGKRRRIDRILLGSGAGHVITIPLTGTDGTLFESGDTGEDGSAVRRGSPRWRRPRRAAYDARSARTSVGIWERSNHERNLKNLGCLIRGTQRAIPNWYGRRHDASSIGLAAEAQLQVDRLPPLREDGVSPLQPRVPVNNGRRLFDNEACLLHCEASVWTDRRASEILKTKRRWWCDGRSCFSW